MVYKPFYQWIWFYTVRLHVFNSSYPNTVLSAYLLDEHLPQPLITGVEKHLIQLAQRLQVNPIHLEKLSDWSEPLF